MATNHGGEPLGYILGPMGSHWDQKMGQNRKKLPCPTIRIFYYSARSSIWAKIEFMNFLLLRGHRFGQKIEFTVMAPNHGGDHLGYILGPMGSDWAQKMGQNRK